MAVGRFIKHVPKNGLRPAFPRLVGEPGQRPFPPRAQHVGSYLMIKRGVLIARGLATFPREYESRAFIDSSPPVRPVLLLGLHSRPKLLPASPMSCSL